MKLELDRALVELEDPIQKLVATYKVYDKFVVDCDLMQM
jgi:hypothetical protein